MPAHQDYFPSRFVQAIKTIESDHSAHQDPLAIVEALRILKLHAR